MPDNCDNIVSWVSLNYSTLTSSAFYFLDRVFQSNFEIWGDRHFQERLCTDVRLQTGFDLTGFSLFSSVGSVF